MAKLVPGQSVVLVKASSPCEVVTFELLGKAAPGYEILFQVAQYATPERKGSPLSAYGGQRSRAEARREWRRYQAQGYAVAA